MAEWDDEIDELYAGEPAGFVAARTALAKRLKADGDKDRAADVARLARPTVVAWALNQAVREDPDRVGALIAAAERQATAQSDVMGGGDAGELRAATAARREAAAEIVRAAAARTGPAHTDAVRNTLDAALADPDLLDRLRAGTLADTLDAPAGFGFGLDAAPATTRSRPRATPSRKGTAKGKASVGGAPDDGPDAAAEERENARVAARAEGRAVVARLEADAATAAAAAEAAATDLEEADDEVRDAEDALTAARLAMNQATETLATARSAHDQATAALDEARRLLAELDADDGR